MSDDGCRSEAGGCLRTGNNSLLRPFALLANEPLLLSSMRDASLRTGAGAAALITLGGGSILTAGYGLSAPSYLSSSSSSTLINKYAEKHPIRNNPSIGIDVISMIALSLNNAAPPPAVFASFSALS